MKMKSLKFMLISALVMLGTTAFAATDPDFRKDNIGFIKNFQAGEDGTAAKPYSVTVVCAYAEDNLTIPDAFTKTDALEKEVNYKVTGFQDGWEANTGAYTEAKSVAGKLKTLTVSAKNMANLKEAFDGLTVLESLTISTAPDAWTDIAVVVGAIGTPGKIKTLDLGALAKVAGGMTTTVNKADGFTALTTLTLPANVTKLPASFLEESTVATINNLGKVTEIGASALKKTKIAAIDLSKVTSLGANALEGTAITEVTIPATLATIGADAFKDCAALTTVTINRNATNGNVPAAFAGCNKVTTLNLVGAETVAANAFADMPLTKIDLSKCPNLVAPKNAFKAGQALSKVKLAGSKTPLANIDLTTSQNSLKSITLWAGETSIPATQFKGFVKLASINLPATITSIGANAFDGSALEAITIPEGCQVGIEAFKDCSALATVTFVNEKGTKTTIASGAFEATALTEVVLPKNVDFLGGVDAFKDCAVLKTFVAEAITSVPAAFSGCDKLKAVVLPGTVKSISANAFKDLAKLASVKLNYDPEDPTQKLNFIGASAFQNCVALTEIDLSATKLTALYNNDVFAGCIALAKITLPEEMDDLSGKGIFAETAIETLDASMVDGNVNNIFGTDLTVDPQVTNNTLKVLKFGNATIFSSAFSGCTKLKTLVTGAATINPYAFEYCEKLATVTVDPYDEDAGKAANIRWSAFDHCTALTTFNWSTEEIDLSNWGSINTQAFTYCTPYLTINTTKEFAAYYGDAPVNATWTADALTTIVKTVQDKANANQFVAKFWAPAYDVAFSAEDVKLYSVYVDGENAYFSACRAVDGNYYVQAGEHVILKTTEEKEVPYEVVTWGIPKPSVAFDDIESLAVDGELGDIQAKLGVSTGDYVYRLTNTAEQGFGFTAYTATTVKANQFFISTTKKPASGRLNTVWLDEDGNVEGEATAINKIESVDANDGAIYNMQGVRVEKAQKGIYIQNGKKIVVK